MEYRIGDFALITRMSVKVLRNYHENGLLKPMRIDDITGYRYYNNEQIRQAEIIKSLKNWNFTLKEIGEILRECHDDHQLVEVVKKKQKEVRDQMNKLKIIDRDLSKLIMAEEEKESMKINETNEITIKKVKELKIISLTYRGPFDECGKYMGRLFKAAKGKVSGRVFNMYQEDLDLDDPLVKVCLPVKSEINHREIQYEILPEERILSTIHKGSYDTIGKSYERLINHREEFSQKQNGPFREIYLKGPGMIFAGNPDRYITEIQMPISDN